MVTAMDWASNPGTGTTGIETEPLWNPGAPPYQPLPFQVSLPPRAPGVILGSGDTSYSWNLKYKTPVNPTSTPRDTGVGVYRGIYT